MRKALNISLFVIIIVSLLTLCAYLAYDYFNENLKKINLNIVRNQDNGFIKYEDTYELISTICDTAVNNTIKTIPVDSLNTILSQNPWAIDVKTGINLDAELNVQILECEPIMRIYNSRNESVYIDADGNIYPEKNDYVPRLLIGSGYLNFSEKTLGNVNDESYQDTKLPGMFKIIKAVLEDDFSRCCVKQVFLDKNKNFKFSMNNTNIIVIFGDDNNIEEKLFNMRKFFMRMQGNPELENYKEININFKNQVVCTKSKIK